MPGSDGGRQYFRTPQSYESGHSSAYDYGLELLGDLQPERGERILDLGCGPGHLTNEIADAVGQAGEVVGIDRVPALIEHSRAEYPNLTFERADPADYRPEEPFDAVFSNAALHWFTDHEGVAESVAAALRPGGRYVVEFAGRGTVSPIVDAVVAALQERGYAPTLSWQFGTIGGHASVLEDAGLEVRRATLEDRPRELDGGEDALQDWLETFGGSLMDGLEATEQAAVIETVVDRLRPALYDPATETWTTTYRALQLFAVRE